MAARVILVREKLTMCCQVLRLRGGWTCKRCTLGKIESGWDCFCGTLQERNRRVREESTVPRFSPDGDYEITPTTALGMKY